jgi:multisubunit Na+/H+ antiporter MnhC subunit
LLLGAFAAAQLAAFWAALDRYRFGSPPRLSPRYGSWNPPLPAFVLLTVMVIALAALQLWCVTLVRQRDQPRHGRPALVTTPATSTGT